MTLRTLSTFTIISIVVAFALAQPAQNPAHVELIADVSAIKPGEPFTVGIRFTLEPHWHVYWINPGDSGQPPEVKWKLPEGFTVSSLQFPVPKGFEQPGGFAGYGYEDEVLLTATITPPKDLRPGSTIKLGGEVSWLACDPNICIPGDATLSIELPVTQSSKPANELLFDSWRERMPQAPQEVGAKVSVAGDMQRGEIHVRIDWSGPAPAHAEWFPPPTGDVEWTDVKVMREGNRTIVITKPKLLAGKLPPTTPMDSLLAYDAGDGSRRGVVASFVYPRQTTGRPNRSHPSEGGSNE
jgi:DsbC/DsbD-like thiol-disulfide interchange protein